MRRETVTATIYGADDSEIIVSAIVIEAEPRVWMRADGTGDPGCDAHVEDIWAHDMHGKPVNLNPEQEAEAIKAVMESYEEGK